MPRRPSTAAATPPTGQRANPRAYQSSSLVEPPRPFKAARPAAVRPTGWTTPTGPSRVLLRVSLQGSLLGGAGPAFPPTRPTEIPPFSSRAASPAVEAGHRPGLGL